MTTSSYGTSSGSDAVARYRYLLSTSSPDQIEQAHQEAFAAMTPAERQQVLTALAQNGETPADSSAGSLARSATRLEMKKPGTMSSLLGNMGTGGTILASLAAGFIGSAVWDGLTGGDGVGGRPGLLSRLFGGGRRAGLGGMMGGMGGGMFGGNGGGGFFGGGGPGGPGGGGFDRRREGGPGGGGPGGGGFGGPGGGGPGGGGGFGGGPGAGGGF